MLVPTLTCYQKLTYFFIWLFKMIPNMNWFVNRLLIKDHSTYFSNAPRTGAVLILGIVCPWLRSCQVPYYNKHFANGMFFQNISVWYICIFCRKTVSRFQYCLQYLYSSRCMRFPTMRYVRPAKPQISLRIRAV